MRFVNSYHFTSEQVDHVRTLLPEADEDFFRWLSQVDCSQVRVYAMKEGSVCFPRIPLIRVEGPVAVCQLLETPLLCLINYATLIATNAARLRMAAPNKVGCTQVV
jgi:nicotinate phosphoribosyltransferase